MKTYRVYLENGEQYTYETNGRWDTHLWQEMIKMGSMPRGIARIEEV